MAHRVTSLRGFPVGRGASVVAVVTLLVLSLTAIRAQAAPFGNSLLLDGVDDYAYVADGGALDLGTLDGQGFTIEAFVYVPNETDDGNQVVFHKNWAYALSIDFSSTSADTIAFTLWDSVTHASTLSSTTSLGTGWHHIAAVFDNRRVPASDEAAIYFDGVRLASDPSLALTGVHDSDVLLSVGANSGLFPFDGWIDEARLSDTVRYSGETYTVPSSAFTPDANTRALWHFDDPVCSTSFTDSSENGDTLTGLAGAQTGQQGASAPTVAFGSASYAIGEDAGSATITVTRAGDPVPAVGVSYSTSDGTATAGSDYTSTGGTLHFACGKTSRTFDVPITDDPEIEGDETVNLSLGSPTGGASLGDPSTATLTVSDDDATQLRFARSRYSFRESAGTVQLTVARSGTTGNEVGVSYDVTGGTALPGADFELPPGTLTFAPGEVSETIDLVVTDDTVAEQPETIVVGLSSPTNGATLDPPSSTTVTIKKSDQQPDGQISRRSSSGYIGDGVYNTTAADQTQDASARPGAERSFYVRVYNDGTGTDIFALRGSASPKGAVVTYLRGTTDVTAAMLSPDGYSIWVAPGSFKLVRIRITIGATAAIGSVKEATVTASWTGDVTLLDAVKAVVTVI